MMEVFRRGIPIEKLATLSEASSRLGGSRWLLKTYKKESENFPRKVARVGHYDFYVFKELENFYARILWKQRDKEIERVYGKNYLP